MNKTSFFEAIRNYVNANGIEPRAGFVNNNLSVTVGEFSFAIEGRNHGNGYVTVRRNGACIASELEIHAVYDEDQCIAAALAIVQDKERKHHDAAANTAETRAEELSRVFAGHPPIRADALSDAETDWLATSI